MLTKLIVVFCLISLHCCLAKLPPTIKPCHRNDPNLENCIIKTVYALKPYMAVGDFGGGYRTPPLEPLQLEDIEMGRGTQFHALFSNLIARGGSNFIINQLKANSSAITYDVNLTLPRIEFSGKYFLKLNILLLHIQGKGDMRGVAENAKAIVKMRGARYLKDGKEYVKITKMNMHLSVGIFKLRLDNLFNGDKTLGELGNAIINDNYQLYLNEIIPGLEKGLSQQFVHVANEILSHTTFDELFPTN